MTMQSADQMAAIKLAEEDAPVNEASSKEAPAIGFPASLLPPEGKFISLSSDAPKSAPAIGFPASSLPSEGGFISLSSDAPEPAPAIGFPASSLPSEGGFISLSSDEPESAPAIGFPASSLPSEGKFISPSSDEPKSAPAIGFPASSLPSEGKFISLSSNAPKPAPAIGFSVASLLTKEQVNALPSDVTAATPTFKGQAASKGQVATFSAVPSATGAASSGYVPDLFEVLLGLSWKKKSILYRQLASAINAGVSVERAVDLSNRDLSSSVRRDMEINCRKMPLSQLWNRYPNSFSVFEVAMLQAGELSGGLDKSLQRLADYAEEMNTISTEVRNQAIYPLILVHAAIFILPIPLFVSNPLAYLFVVLGCLGVLYGIGLFLWFISRVLSIDSGLQVLFYSIVNWLPIVGRITRCNAQSRFLECFSHLHASGLLANQSVEIAADACGNAACTQRLRKMGATITAGATISQAMALSSVFDKQVVSMLEAGELTGDLAEVAHKAATYQRQEAQTAQKRMMTIVPVLILAIIGVMIGFFVIHTFSGYVQILNNAM